MPRVAGGGGGGRGREKETCLLGGPEGCSCLECSVCRCRPSPQWEELLEGSPGCRLPQTAMSLDFRLALLRGGIAVLLRAEPICRLHFRPADTESVLLLCTPVESREGWCQEGWPALSADWNLASAPSTRCSPASHASQFYPPCLLCSAAPAPLSVFALAGRHSFLKVAHPPRSVPAWASSALLVLFPCLSHTPLPASFQLSLPCSHTRLRCRFLPRSLVLSSSSPPFHGALSSTLLLSHSLLLVYLCVSSEPKNHFPKHTGGPRAGLEQLHRENKKGFWVAFFFFIHNRKNETGSQALNSDLRKDLKPLGQKVL